MVTVMAQVTASVMGSRKEKQTASIEINDLHKNLGRFRQSHCKLTARTYDINVFGKLEAYEAYAISGAKQERKNKVQTGSSKVTGERLYVDISLIKGECFGIAKLWTLLLGDYTYSCWSGKDVWYQACIRRYYLYLLYSLRVNTTERRSSNSEELKLQIDD